MTELTTKLREALAKATPGEWKQSFVPTVIRDVRTDVAIGATHGDHEKEHAELIVLLHNSAPALLDYIEKLEEVAKAAWDVVRYEGAEPEPCWRCGGGGSYCEERLGELLDCRCCGGSGQHCTMAHGPVGEKIVRVACVSHNPKKFLEDCQQYPELFKALAALPERPL